MGASRARDCKHHRLGIAMDPEGVENMYHLAQRAQGNHRLFWFARGNWLLYHARGNWLLYHVKTIEFAGIACKKMDKHRVAMSGTSRSVSEASGCVPSTACEVFGVP